MSDRSAPAIPGPRALGLLALVGSIAVEYVAWPSLEPATPLAGAWSVAGNLLLAALLAVLWAEVLLPMGRRLAPLLASGRARALFAVGSAGGLVAWMGATSSIAVAVEGARGGSEAGALPYLSPFGALPTFEFSVDGGTVVGSLSPMLLLYATLSVLSCGAAGLAIAARAGRPPAPRSRGSGARAAAVASTLAGFLPPSGLAVSCCTTPVLLAAVLGLAGASPGVEALGRFTGMLDGIAALGATGLALLAVRLATRPACRRSRDRAPTAREVGS